MVAAAAEERGELKIAATEGSLRGMSWAAAAAAVPAAWPPLEDDDQRRLHIHIPWRLASTGNVTARAWGRGQCQPNLVDEKRSD